MKDHQNHIPSRAGRGPISTRSRHVVAGALGVLALLLAFPTAARAQSHQVRANPTRLTVQSGQSGVITTRIYVIVDTNDTINLAVGSTPVNVTGTTLTPSSFTAPADNRLRSSALLTVNYNGSVPQTGVNEIVINASGDYTYRLPVPINSAVIWDGDTNNTAFATAGNWQGAAVPTSSDIAVFPSAGANDHGTNSFTNVVLSSSAAVGGLRFSHGDKSGDQNYGFEIKSGATLSVTGTRGFTFLQDTIDLVGDMEVDFFGGGNLVVSNQNADFTMLKGYQQDSVLDMGGLNTFVADVNRIGLGDYTFYPNYTTNGYEITKNSQSNAAPNRFLPFVTLAKTNFIKAAYVGGENILTNPYNRDYSMTISKTEDQATGSGSQFRFLLGRTNVFFMESIVFGAAGAKAENDNRIIFNTDTNVIPTNVVPVAYFRGADGTSRMSVFTVADASNPGASGSGTKATVNLTGGRVDARIDRLYLARDTQESQDNDSAQARLSIGRAGTVFDVNTAFISSQELGNVVTSEGGGDFSAEVDATLDVVSNALFKVNGTLHLGYTTAEANDLRDAEAGDGQINIRSGGTLMASNIFVGGVTKVSVNNRISITGGGELIVTNAIGQTDKSLAALSMTDSTLTLHVDGSKSDAYVFTDQLNTSGAGNTIKLASIANVVSFPTQLPLIKYGSASPNFGVAFPSGYYGYIINNLANQTIDVVILNTPPANLVWAGTPGATWDTIAANWQGGLKFANGDTARFDDNATGSTTVNVSGTVFVGGFGVLITNQVKPYTFNGGTIGGTAPMNKWGSGSLAINATSELPLTIHQGSVTGSGAIGSTTVESNTSLTFSGDLNRLTTAGTTVLSSTAKVANGATVEGGTLMNSGRSAAP